MSTITFTPSLARRVHSGGGDPEWEGDRPIGYLAVEHVRPVAHYLRCPVTIDFRRRDREARERGELCEPELRMQVVPVWASPRAALAERGLDSCWCLQDSLDAAADED